MTKILIPILILSISCSTLLLPAQVYAETPSAESINRAKKNRAKRIKRARKKGKISKKQARKLRRKNKNSTYKKKKVLAKKRRARAVKLKKTNRKRTPTPKGLYGSKHDKYKKSKSKK